MTRSAAVSIRTSTDADLTIDDLVSLSGTGPSQRVSLYLPTHRSGREVTQDPVRLRQLVRLAADEITDGELLATTRSIEADRAASARGHAGLALLVEAGAVLAVGLAEPVDDLWVVGDRFHLKPLVRAMNRRVEFDVLALSRNAVRLVHGTRSAATEVQVPDLPTSMSEALRWDDRERQLQSHAAGRTGSGKVAAAFHGQGGAADTRDVDLDRYLHMIDRALTGHRAGSAHPLVLAGVDDVVAAFRKTTRCPHVLDAHIGGNPDQRTVDELADGARGLVRPARSDAEQRAREAFHAGKAATVDTVEQAVIAAAAGQIDSIFVAADRSVWGRYRDGHTLIDEHDEREPGDHDLTDVAVSETLRHGGAAYIVGPDDVPGGGTTAAVLHF